VVAEEIYFEALSKELADQRQGRESLRTRAIAVLSAGAIIFALSRTQSVGNHLDAWLLAAVMALVAMGFSVALVLAPAPINSLEPFLDPDSIAASSGDETREEAERRFYGDLLTRVKTGIRSNRLWYNQASLFYLTSTILLVVEIALIAAHFSDSSAFRIAIMAATAFFLLIPGLPAQLNVRPGQGGAPHNGRAEIGQRQGGSVNYLTASRPGSSHQWRSTRPSRAHTDYCSMLGVLDSDAVPNFGSPKRY